MTATIFRPESVTAVTSEAITLDFKMSPLYLTTMIGLLVTSTVLVSGAPVYNDRANMLDRLSSLLDQVENQEQAQMTEIGQEEADIEDQEDLLSHMIQEMLINKQAEKESSVSLQEENEQAERQTLYDKLNTIEKEVQEIAQAMREKEMLLKIQRG